MADLIGDDVCLWVNQVGCRQTRVALLALEPGSRVWLNVEGNPILFERLRDDSDGRSRRGFRPIGDSIATWAMVRRDQRNELLEFDFIERPDDRDAAGTGYYQLDLTHEVTRNHA